MKSFLACQASATDASDLTGQKVVCSRFTCSCHCALQGPAPMPVGQAVEDGHLVNSSSYAHRAPNDRWTGEDTELFYKVRRVRACALVLHCACT